MRFHVALPVWGSSYVKTFLDYCLPAQLSRQNLPSVGTDLLYRIYTTPEDFGTIQVHPAFKALQAIAATEVEYISPRDAKYDVKSDCYRHAISRAVDERAALCALNADIVLANGFVKATLDLLTAGKRVLQVPAPRALMEGASIQMERHRQADGAINLSPTELSRVWLGNIHPLLQMHFVDGEGENFHPSHLYWRAGVRGVVARCFHLYPIVVVPQQRANFTVSIDNDLLGNLGLKPSEVAYASDSRKMFACELSAPNHFVGSISKRGDFERIVGFYLGQSRANIENIRQEFIISGSRWLGWQWIMPRRKSARFATEIWDQYWHIVRTKYS
jgi:hypothetical protein